MTYTATTAKAFRQKKGTLSEKLNTEFALIDAEIDVHKTKFMNLTVGAGTDSAVATTGIDLASASNISRYGFFFPTAVTLIAMHDYLTEAYVKETTDAKIEVYNTAATPIKLFGRTLTAAGEAAKTATSTAPETGKASVAAGMAIRLTAVNTAATSGTGHALVVIEYVEA